MTMKSHILFLWLLVSAIPLRASPIDDADALWSFMALHPARNERAHYVMTDNVAGYFEGVAFAHIGGTGYRYRDQHLLQDCIGMVNGQRLQRASAADNVLILPFAVQHDYRAQQESLLLHSGRSVVSCRIRSAQAVKLGIAVLGLFDLSSHISTQNGITLMQSQQPYVSEHSRFVAISSAQKMAPAVRESDSVSLYASDDSNEFVVHLVFAATAEQALTTAKKLRDEAVWKNESQKQFARLQHSYLWTSDTEYNRALLWARASARAFLVEEFGTGIWAGLPWFRDNWGRDTFIALPGTLLVNGEFTQAKAVLDNFLRYQFVADKSLPHYGRVPNRVAANTETIYNTADGTPWLFRELLEYARYSGDRAYLQQQWPRLETYIEGVKRHALDRHGLLKHDDADSWMDARIAGQQAWSPRGDRAVEIQVLWITALDIAADLQAEWGQKERAQMYRSMANTARNSFVKLFWRDGQLADRLRADDSADFTLRPNQLLAISLPFSALVPLADEAALLRHTSNQLLLPYGVLSLAPAHAAFHPRHQNPAFHHKDAAYHNGSIWLWNSGFMISALNKFGRQDLSWTLTQNMAHQIVDGATRGTLSELLDASAEGLQVTPSGTFSQAWSVAEFARNAMQDFLGFQPDILHKQLLFSPALPVQWTQADAKLRLGVDAVLNVSITQKNGVQTWQFKRRGHERFTLNLHLLTPEGARRRVQLAFTQPMLTVIWNGVDAFVNGRRVNSTEVQASQQKITGDIRFATPPPYDEKRYPVLQGQDVLQKWILSGRMVF